MLLDVTQTGTFPQNFHVNTHAGVGMFPWGKVVLLSLVGFRGGRFAHLLPPAPAENGVQEELCAHVPLIQYHPKRAPNKHLPALKSSSLPPSPPQKTHSQACCDVKDGGDHRVGPSGCTCVSRVRVGPRGDREKKSGEVKRTCQSSGSDFC